MARQAKLEERAPASVEPWAWVLYERGGLWLQRKVLGSLSHRPGSLARDPLDVVIATPDQDVYEEYYDLQMPVKGCKDLYASLDEYVKEEILDGDNQYHSDRYGKQDAKKGVLFKSLPPVLELHLRRFEYDFATDAMAKINERFEFPTQLDMDREGRKYFTDEAGARAQPRQRGARRQLRKR